MINRLDRTYSKWQGGLAEFDDGEKERILGYHPWGVQPNIGRYPRDMSVYYIRPLRMARSWFLALFAWVWRGGLASGSLWFFRFFFNLALGEVGGAPNPPTLNGAKITKPPTETDGARKTTDRADSTCRVGNILGPIS